MAHRRPVSPQPGPTNVYAGHARPPQSGYGSPVVPAVVGMPRSRTPISAVGSGHSASDSFLAATEGGGTFRQTDNDQMLQHRVSALEALVNMQPNDSEVSALRRLVERLQLQQEEMSLSLHAIVDEKVVALQVDMVDLEQKIITEQEKPSELNTDALDYAEAEVADLRKHMEYSLGRLQERHEADADIMRRQVSLLVEELKQVQAATDAQGSNAQSKHHQQDAGNISALHEQLQRLENELVVELQTKLVMEKARAARQENATSCAVHALQARIDTLELQQKRSCKLEETAIRPMTDLQALVERQLRDEQS